MDVPPRVHAAPAPLEAAAAQPQVVTKLDRAVAERLNDGRLVRAPVLPRLPHPSSSLPGNYWNSSSAGLMRDVTLGHHAEICQAKPALNFARSSGSLTTRSQSLARRPCSPVSSSGKCSLSEGTDMDL